MLYNTNPVKVFDSYVGVLGVPTEKRIAVEHEDKLYPDLHKYLKKIENSMLPFTTMLCDLNRYIGAELWPLHYALGYSSTLRRV